MMKDWLKKMEIEPNHEKYQKLEKWWKWENWNEAVWDAIGTARKQEKMFWTAEIELYRWVMSNGPYGYKKNLKMVSMFLDLGAEISTRYCWQAIL